MDGQFLQFPLCRGVMDVVFSKTNIRSKVMNTTSAIHYHYYYYYYLIFVFHFALLFRETQSRAITSKHSYSVGTNALPGARKAKCMVYCNTDRDHPPLRLL